MGRKSVIGVVIAASTMLICPAPAAADPPPPGCERIPMLGLNPQIREICDLPIQADGSWERWRWFSHPEFVHSTCGEYGGFVGGQYYCPPWAPKDTVPATDGPVDKYIVTTDTIPAGEPGYLGG
jgi:hypothetical protein